MAFRECAAGTAHLYARLLPAGAQHVSDHIQDLTDAVLFVKIDQHRVSGAALQLRGPQGILRAGKRLDPFRQIFRGVSRFQMQEQDREHGVLRFVSQLLKLPGKRRAVAAVDQHDHLLLFQPGLLFFQLRQLPFHFPLGGGHVFPAVDQKAFDGLQLVAALRAALRVFAGKGADGPVAAPGEQQGKQHAQEQRRQHDNKQHALGNLRGTGRRKCALIQ